MKSRGVNPAFFSTKLEEILDSVRLEVSDITNNLTFSSDFDQIEKQILILNEYYYRSFLERVFPQYLKESKKEITSVLNLSIKEEQLQKIVASSIKRYAQLSNLIKHLLFKLNAWTQINEERIKRLNSETIRSHHHLSTKLSSWLDTFAQVVAIFANLDSIIKDQELLNAGQCFFPLVSFFDFLISRDKNNLESNADLDRLETAIKSQYHQVRQATSVPLDYTREDITSEYDENLNIIAEIKLPQEITWIKDLICHYQLSPKSAPWINDILESILLLFAKAKVRGNFIQPGLLSIALVLRSHNSSSQELIKSIFAQYDECGLYNNPDNFELAEFHESIGPKLNSIAEICQEMQTIIPAKNFDAAFLNTIYRFQAETHYLHNSAAAEVEHLAKRSALIDEYENLNSALKDKCTFLQNFSADIERLLSSRNLNKNTLGINIKIDRVALVPGKPFPSEYLYLLDKYRIAAQIDEKFEIPYLLTTEGDIYIIQAGTEIVEEIPIITIGQKG